MFNPNVKDFLKEKQPSLLGLGWAIYWRFLVAIVLPFYVVIGLIAALFE